MDGKNRSTALLLVVVVLLIMCRCCQAGFAEVPSPVIINVSENQNAVFRCRHERPDAIISWFINGTPSSRYPDVTDGSISESGGTFVDTLTIPAIPVYNGTEVVCVAAFIDGSPTETTPPVMLTITEHSLVTGPPGTFEITPSPLTVAVEQEMATFYCQHLSSDGIYWLVNGTSLNRINSPNITTSSNGRIHSLSIGTHLEYNETTVQCVATFLDGSPPIPTPSVVLLTQDTPGKVKNATCERNASTDANTPKADLTTHWLSLPSLDLNDTDPDIVYSVELYKITCGEDIFMIREDVFVNSTNNTVDPMEIYKVIITARNNVQGARNGTRTEMRENFMTLNKASLFQLSQNSQFNTKDELAPVPSYYTMILEPLDGHQEQNLMINISVERSGEMVNMSVDGEIPTKTLWSASLLAYGCQSDTVVKGVELSTHEIQNISVNNSSQPGEVRVTGSFTDGSTATGLLVIVIGDSEVIYHKTSRDGTDKIKGTLITGLAGGEYSISVFVVEENGLPFERVATSPKLVAVETNDVVTPPSSSIEYSLQSTSTGVCITCTFLDSSATDCVAVVHQRISQLSSSGLMNIKRHKLTRSNDTASGCIEGVNLQIGVIGGVLVTEEINPTVDTMTNGSGLANSNIIVIVGGVLAGVIVVSLVVVIIIFVIIVKNFGREKPRSRSPSPSPESPLPRPTTLGNTYESVSPLGTGAAGVHEGTPLFRVQSDGPTTQRSDESAHAHDATPTSTSPPPYSPPEGDSTLPPPVPPPRTKEDPNVVAYAETVVSKCSTAPPPTEMDKVVYHEVGGTLNAQGQHYTLISDLPTRTSVIPDDLHRTVYSEIKPQDPSSCQVTIAEKNGSEKHSSLTREDKSSTPFSLEHILPEVMPMASKWLALGEALSLDEDRLDEIFTNNETDEACLNVMLEFYMERSNHSWEEIETAMRKVREKDEVMDTSTKDSSPPIPPRDITGQMLYHSNLSPHNNEDYKSSFEEKIVQSDDSCRVDKDGGQFTSGRHETTTVHSVPEKSPVNDDRSCQVTCCCSEESFRPLQRALQQPLTFTSSVQQDAKDSGLNDPNTHQPVVPDQCHNDHESFQQKCDREEKDEGYSSSTLDSSEDSSYPESECVLPIQETEQGHPLEQLIVQGPLVMLQPESLDHLRCHDKQSIECEQLHNIVSVQIHQH